VELEFNEAALAAVRAAAARMTEATMTRDRAIDVVLAVHELAANAVRHGGGRGRLRMHVTGGSMHCEVNDAGQAGRDGRPGARPPAPGSRSPAGVPWPVEPGHGLWLVARACDDLTVVSGPGGSRVTATFALRGRASLPVFPSD